MPKMVDHDDRRVELAGAVWRVAARDGLHAATIRSVATESGWSSGALRHYFPSKSDLLLFAIEQALNDVQRRIDRIDFSRVDRPTIQRLLEELLPLDQPRQLEADAWFALASQSQIDPEIRTRKVELDRMIRGTVQTVIALLGDHGLLAGDRDPAREVIRLHALLDGLVLQLVARPSMLTTEEGRLTLAFHIEDLAR